MASHCPILGPIQRSESPGPGSRMVWYVCSWRSWLNGSMVEDLVAFTLPRPPWAIFFDDLSVTPPHHPSIAARFCSIYASSNIHYTANLCMHMDTTLVKLWYYYLLLIQYITNKCSIPERHLIGSLCPDATISSTPCNPQSALGSSSPTHHTAPYPEFTSSAMPSHTARPGESTEDGAAACLVCAGPTKVQATPRGPYRPSRPIRVL